MGKTVDLGDYVKDNPSGLHPAQAGHPAGPEDSATCVETEWGNVRPSWFLQLGAVALDRLPELTVFLADQAHRFPHLENFKAIWSVGRGVEPRVWMVCESAHLSSDKELAAADLAALAGSKGAARMWLLSTWRRRPLILSEKSLTMWRRNWNKVQCLALDLSRVAAIDPRAGRGGDAGKPAGTPAALSPDLALVASELKVAFAEAMDNDMALHRFWPALFSFCQAVRALLAKGRLSPAEAGVFLAELKEVDAILGLLDESAMPFPPAAWPEEVAELVRQREKARAAKDFALADERRAQIRKAGFRLEDAPEGARLYPAAQGGE